MTWFRVWNKSKLPINCAISWGGIIQHYKNAVEPGGYCEWDVPGLGWHDFTAVPDTGGNRFDFAKNNLAAVGQWVLGGVGVAIAIGGLVLIPFSGGGSTAVVVAGVAIATGGAVVTVADITIAGIHAALHPVSVAGLYGPDGYNMEVSGGEVVGDYDPERKELTVTSVKQLSVHWHNNKTGASGSEYAQH